MMRLILKTRNVPEELAILDSLQRRMPLSKNDQLYYNNLKKGYEGELLFDSYIEKLECDCILLNDLLFKANNQTFQIDSLLITKNKICLFEIKNYGGDYYYKSDQLLKNDHSEITNPLIQLHRTESLLCQLLIKLNTTIPIQASVIFINPEFMLYQAPPEKPFVFPSQLNRFIKNLNSDRSQLQEYHKKLAENLMSLHILDNPYQHLPSYHYHQLKKGIICSACNSFELTIKGMKLICNSCENEEQIDSATYRTVMEFKLLFPNEKVTTRKIYEWCNLLISTKSIQRILKIHFTPVNVLRWVYYD